MSAKYQSVNDFLRAELNNNQNTKEISLQFKSINELLPLLHLLGEFPKLQKLLLHGNRIKELPMDLSMLHNLEQLDLSNNLLDQNKLDLTLRALCTIPNLKSLHYQISKQREKKIAQAIRTLEYLNNTRIIREPAKKQYQFHRANEKNLGDFEDKMSSLFEDLLEYEVKYLGENKEVDAAKKFSQEVNMISQDCLEKLKMGKDRATDSLESIMLYTTKFQMYEVLKTRSLNICQDIYSDLGKFLKDILDQEDKLFKMVAEQSLSLARSELDSKQREEEDKFATQFQKQHSIVNKNSIMQKELKRMRRQKDQYIAEINQLENQNKKLMDAIIKYAKGDTSNLGRNMPLIATFQSKNNQRLRDSKDVSISEGTRNVLSLTPKANISKNQVRSQIANREQAAQAYQVNYGSNSRNLTLKQLKDVIEQIYEAKLKFDDKNFNSKLPRQTMAQYFWTHLAQKYGLKTLTLQAANSITSGIEHYKEEDNDITVFGKIYKNQIDQQFRFVQTELKSTIHTILKYNMKARLNFRKEDEINELVKQKVNAEIQIEECEEIVKHLYNKNDSQLIIQKIEQSLKSLKGRDEGSHSAHRKKREDITATDKTKKKIKFFYFMQIVLEFQMKHHQKFLKPLVNAFKMRDHDSDGIVDQQEFISIIKLLCPDSQDLIPNLLDIVDPYETKTITFTQMARLVSTYPENSPILTRFINSGKQFLLDDGASDEQNMQDM